MHYDEPRGDAPVTWHVRGDPQPSPRVMHPGPTCVPHQRSRPHQPCASPRHVSYLRHLGSPAPGHGPGVVLRTRLPPTGHRHVCAGTATVAVAPARGPPPRRAVIFRHTGRIGHASPVAARGAAGRAFLIGAGLPQTLRESAPIMMSVEGRTTGPTGPARPVSRAGSPRRRSSGRFREVCRGAGVRPGGGAAAWSSRRPDGPARSPRRGARRPAR